MTRRYLNDCGRVPYIAAVYWPNPTRVPKWHFWNVLWWRARRFWCGLVK